MKITVFLYFFFVFLSNALASTFEQHVTSSVTVFFQQNSNSGTVGGGTTETQTIAWIANMSSARKRQRRNPLRKNRKALRQLRLQQRRLLKKTKKESADFAVVEAKKTLVPAANPNSAIEEAVLKKKSGRRAVIAVSHLFCPNPNCQGYQILGTDPRHNIVGSGTYTTKSGEVRQLYLCKLCGKKFSETKGTVFFGLKTPTETIYRALASLAEGQSIRATARIFSVDKDTVLLWLRRAGQHSEQVSSYLIVNHKVKQVQLDELWTFIVKKEKNLSAWEKLHSEYGDAWVWTAIDPVHKLVLGFHVGEHEEKDADTFLQKVKASLAEGCVPVLTSDQLPHYVGAILKVFGRLVQLNRKGSRGRFPNPVLEPTEDLAYATVCKERKEGRIVSVVTKVVFGTVEGVLNRLKAMGMKINTAFVERMNLTLRHLVSRLRRKGLAFSKDRQHLEWHLHLSLAYYHFVRPHRSLRRRLPEAVPTKGAGSPKIWEKRTPAMSAGFTDHIWSMKELLSLRVPKVEVTPA